MPELGAQFTIYRGEVRRAFPTPERPDPAAALRQDPQGFMQDWMRHSYPYPSGYYGHNLSVGQHWTRSPEIIPERFSIEHLSQGNPFQPGVPMGKREATAISRRQWVDRAYDTVPKMSDEEYDATWDLPREERDAKLDEHRAKVAEHWKTLGRYESYLRTAERQGRNTFLGESSVAPQPGEAVPYKMAVIWHGHAPHFETGTNYEDEHNLPHESTVNITGARVYIPSAGETRKYGQSFKSPFTAEEMARATHDVWNRSAYSSISPTSSVPWSRVQFDEPIEVPVKHHQSIWHGR